MNTVQKWKVSSSPQHYIESLTLRWMLRQEDITSEKVYRYLLREGRAYREFRLR